MLLCIYTKILANANYNSKQNIIMYTVIVYTAMSFLKREQSNTNNSVIHKFSFTILNEFILENERNK